MKWSEFKKTVDEKLEALNGPDFDPEVGSLDVLGSVDTTKTLVILVHDNELDIF